MQLRNQAIQFICDSFVVAIGRGLKRPMIRLHFRDQRFKIYLSAKGTICLKTGKVATDGSHDPIGDEVYMGCLLYGRFLPATEWDAINRRRGPERKLTETERLFLDGISADPVGFMATCSKDLNRCCYCNLPLEDERSKQLGYGKVCAGRWGLPWGEKGYTEGAPSFASLYCFEASTLCSAIRADAFGDGPWYALSDWLQERGLALVFEQPKEGTRMPRNDSCGTQVRTPVAQSATHQHNGCCENGGHWTTVKENEYAAEMTKLPKVKPCPKCRETIMKGHLNREVKSYDETRFWEFCHPCGARLTIVNQ